jgi:hypothetical protein
MLAWRAHVSSEIQKLFSQVRRPTTKLDTYFAAYDELFAPYKGRNITFVEVGISGGGSLEVWKRYFGPGSRIIGIDLNPELRDILAKDGFEVFIGDQADPAFWRSFYESVGPIDVLLDDGGHTNTQMWTTLTSALDHVRDGGLLVIEDTHAAYMRKFGNPSSHSIVARMAACIDEINYRSTLIDDRDRRTRSRDRARLLAGANIAGKVHGIRFYESIIALSIDASKCTPSRKTDFGSADQLPRGQLPVDYRDHGLREAWMHRIRGRIQSLVSRIPRDFRRR